MPWFHRREREELSLLKVLLANDGERIKATAALDLQKAALEQRKLELEMEHIEALGEERRKDRRELVALRERRVAHAKQMREKKQQMRSNPAPDQGQQICRVCAEPGSAMLSAQEIWWHGNGHPQGGPGAIEWPQ